MKITPIVFAAGFLAQSVFAQATLKSLAAAKGKYIGAAADNGELIDPRFQQIIGEQFHSTTPGNGMKWDAIEPRQGTFNFAKGDEILAFAQSKGMTVRGHTLVWHSQLPGWVANGNWTRETLTAVIENHINTVVNHYKGTLFHWDVVNEIFNEDGTWRDTVFYRVLGEDFVSLAFRTARAADPNAKLYINDYNIDGSGPKSTAMFNLVQKLRAEGVPIDGIGSQAHLIVGSIPSSFESNLQNFASLGVDVALTELDIRTSTPISEAKSQQQLLDYKTTVGACVNTPSCVGVTIWGFTDRYSWIPSTFPGEGDALPWDKNYNRKAAHDGIVLALGGTPEPRPTTTTTVGGAIPTPVGMYPIHVGSGLESGWQNWGWNVKTDAFYAGPPAPVVGTSVLRGLTNQGSYGGVSLFGGPTPFQGKKLLGFYVASDAPNNFGVRLESTAEGFTAPVIPLTAACPNYVVVADAFTECTVDLTAYGAHAWDRVSWMASTTNSVNIYLSNVWLAVAPAPAVTTTTTSTCAVVTLPAVTSTVTQVPAVTNTVTETLPASTITEVSTTTLPASTITETQTLPASTITKTSTTVSITTSVSTTLSTITSVKTETATKTTTRTVTAIHTVVCSPKWGQCGGNDWEGPTCCQSGTTCQKQGPYYSQCL
ncbi:hypothetical protein HK097_005611 [Rhizophlyctis rosea]|uniref:Beta-xylanase n=1 Tax=Rhizophlyctis rosea TaxID=64517 RepID=A0AAD5SL43_9FUNG|nr:hypothetical protein HK097_005611 [Rhizophlyctis rosea]